MSVYSRGDANREKEDDKKKKKPDVLDEMSNAFEQVGKDLSVGFSNLFSGGKEKKWSKKGEGHTLGTAADAEAAREARLAALQQPPPPPQPARPMPAMNTPALAAAEARASGKKPAPAAPPRAPKAPAPPGQSFPGPGYVAANPQATYAQEIRMLCEMGFSEGVATRALVASEGEIERAVELLSSGQVGGGDGGGVSTSSAQPPPPPPGAADGVPPLEMLMEAATATAEDIPMLATRLSGMRGGGNALSLVRKLVGNVQASPAEAKFRQVRLTNQKITERLGGSVEAYALLLACGFALGDDGTHATMGDESAADGAALEVRCHLLDEAIAIAQSGGPPVPVGPEDIKVLVVPEGKPMRFEEVGDDYYQITPAEAKALMDLNAAKRADEEQFKTKEKRELEAARRKRVYRKTMIRVRFPDGIVLQATFSAAATVGVVLSWVESALREPGHAFELSLAASPPLKEMGETLEASGLAPAALLNFRMPAAEQMSPPFLHADLMATAQLMGAEVIPQGTSLEEARTFQEARGDPSKGRSMSSGRGDGEGKKPKWLQPRP